MRVICENRFWADWPGFRIPTLCTKQNNPAKSFVMAHKVTIIVGTREQHYFGAQPYLIFHTVWNITLCGELDFENSGN